MRRLPVYLLLDTSGSMRGEPIASVNVGLQTMMSTLRRDPSALETVHVCIITFDLDAKVVVPLTALELLVLPEITTPDSGPTMLGEALQAVCNMVDAEVVPSAPDQKGDWAPLLFVMTDGSPTDLQAFEEVVPVVKAKGFGNIIACAAGPKAKKDFLLQFTDNVVMLDTVDATALSSFFKWVSTAVGAGSRSQGTAASAELPPPPAEIQFVV